jgi:hypothetical protein
MTITWMDLEAFATARCNGDSRLAVSLRDGLVGKFIELENRIREIEFAKHPEEGDNFQRWVPRAYADPYAPGRAFTIYNMEVAYVAGGNRVAMTMARKQSSLDSLISGLETALTELRAYQERQTDA